MALSRDTIKILLFAGLCVAMVLTLYFVSKRSSVNEKFANGVPPLGKAVPPFGCKQTIDKAMAAGPAAADSFMKKNMFCEDDDMCCDYIANYFLPDMTIGTLIDSAKKANILPYEGLGQMMLDGMPAQTDKLTGEPLPKDPDMAMLLFRIIKRMQDLNIPVNKAEWNSLQKAAAASKSASKTATAAASEPKIDFNYDKSGTGITGFESTSVRSKTF